MGARPRSRRTAADRPDGQHLLRSVIADELVRDAGIRADDLVVEIGAGDGRLTAPLARRASHVVAIEIDPRFAGRLRERFDSDPRVTVVHADAHVVPLPEEPFRAFGNIPFGITNALLRRLLDDPLSPLTRADLIVQWEVGRKRSDVWPSTALTLGWAPWWELSSTRRIPRTAFDPPPSVDAAVVRVTRRTPALLGAEHRDAYVDLVRDAFVQPTWPVQRVLRETLRPLAWKRFARQRGLPLGSTPRHLDTWDWLALYHLVERSGLESVTLTRRAPRPRDRRGQPRRR